MPSTKKSQASSSAAATFLPLLLKLIPSSKKGKTVSAALVAVLAAAGITVAGNEDLRTSVTGGDAGPAATTDGSVDQSHDYVRVTGTAHRDHEATAGKITYCPLDAFSRATCAYGELTGDLRAAAKSRGRQDITVNPAGWGHNAKVTIPALTDLKGSKKYHGYMYNRSHLLADSLGGDPTLANLVTGTRGQNVGSAGNDGGMAYTEEIARDYLDGGTGADADACPLYYAATPDYTGNELLPRTVTVDIQSCDRSIDQRVVVDNTANGYVIDYVNGSFSS